MTQFRTTDPELATAAAELEKRLFKANFETSVKLGEEFCDKWDEHPDFYQIEQDLGF